MARHKRLYLITDMQTGRTFTVKAFSVEQAAHFGGYKLSDIQGKKISVVKIDKP